MPHATGLHHTPAHVTHLLHRCDVCAPAASAQDDLWPAAWPCTITQRTWPCAVVSPRKISASGLQECAVRPTLSVGAEDVEDDPVGGEKNSQDFDPEVNPEVSEETCFAGIPRRVEGCSLPWSAHRFLVTLGKELRADGMS